MRAAVFAYLAITHLGGAGVWVAMLRSPSTARSATRGARGRGRAQTLVAVAALVGFGTKAGLVPLHSWLPRAHPVAPAHLSALMSGVMIKVALYGLIRVEFEWLGATPLWLGHRAARRSGSLSALGGVLWALVQHDLKRLLAFHSIENVGIIALGARRLAAASRDAGATRVGGDRVRRRAAAHRQPRDLQGAAVPRRRRVRARGRARSSSTGSAGCCGACRGPAGRSWSAAMAIAGLPPLNGFASEWLTLQALLHVALERAARRRARGRASRWPALAATAALALFCFVKVVGLVLLGAPRRASVRGGGRGAARRCAPALVVLAAAVRRARRSCPGSSCPTLAGLAPGGERGAAPARRARPCPAPARCRRSALALALARARRRCSCAARGARRAAPAPSWACGQPVVPALQWTSAGFTKPLRLVLEARAAPAARDRGRRRERGVVQRVALLAARCRARSTRCSTSRRSAPALRAARASRGGCRRATCAPTPLYLLALVARPARARRASGALG